MSIPFFVIVVLLMGLMYAGGATSMLRLGRRQGYALGKAHTPALKAKKIECLCEHGPNFHNRKKGNRCEFIVSHKTYDRRGKAYFVAERCGCLCYTGPEFLPEYVSPVELELSK